MKVVLTGAAGFLGWHTRLRLFATRPDIDVVPVSRSQWPDLSAHLAGVDAVIHVAGHNRGDDAELADGNTALATDLVAALDATLASPRDAPAQPPTIVYAGSTYVDEGHWGVDSPYAAGKRAAGDILRAWGRRVGARVVEVRFTGLFGEHGRPDYNSVVATFAHRVVAGRAPQIVGDRELPLLHVQDAAQALIDALAPDSPDLLRPPGHPMLISAIARRLREMHGVYAVSQGDIPALPDVYDVHLFNTLRAAMWPQAYPLRPTPRTDERGALVEAIRVHGGTGQAFVSTTHPGYTRGDHLHLHKIERFHVLSGAGVIRLRRAFTDEVLEFAVSGDEPAVIDMPTGWTHSIENTGDRELVTFFWTNELFDPQAPDTYPCRVLGGADQSGPRGPNRASGPS